MTRARRLRRILRPFRDFVRLESFSGLLILAAIVAATAAVNSPWAGAYDRVWQTPLAFSLGSFRIAEPVVGWINDGLMVLFFFLVGLEIKRELLVGELSSPRQALFPVVAALGGMATPALVYLAVNAGGGAPGGWPVPMATDIAVALGVLSLLGNKIPVSLKVFLASLAIIDDIGAILVIGVVFTGPLHQGALLAAGGFLLLLAAANRLGVQATLVYAVLGAGLWLAVLESGIHATLAGVLAAMTIPARARLDQGQFIVKARAALDDFTAARDNSPDANILANPESLSAVHSLKASCTLAETPLQRMETAIHPVVAYVILPLFAFANGGFALDAASLASAAQSPAGLGTALGLVAGKPLGIVLFTWLSHRLDLARKPADLTWAQITALGFIAGIGFTMAVFMANLAFAGTADAGPVKVSVFLASLTAGLAGYLMLARSTGRTES